MNSSDRLDRIEAILAATAIQQQANTAAIDRLTDRVDRIAVQQQANTLGSRAAGSSNQRQHRSHRPTDRARWQYCGTATGKHRATWSFSWSGRSHGFSNWEPSRSAEADFSTAQRMAGANANHSDRNSRPLAIPQQPTPQPWQRWRAKLKRLLSERGCGEVAGARLLKLLCI